MPAFAAEYRECVWAEIIVPVGFSAQRDGTDALDGVKISGDSGESVLLISHFASGILTFHKRTLFKREPRYDLFVSGWANVMQDGLRPLSEVIKTD
ncbi:MAG: DUF6065 family protein [Alphaproteobacteria bacterium]|nr:DUF6065 family protein [Alphaproteobacteria bacterium]